MIKRINISQLNSKMRQIQNKTNQQLKKIQRDVLLFILGLLELPLKMYPLLILFFIQ